MNACGSRPRRGIGWWGLTLSFLCCFTCGRVVQADILLPGHKSVTHELLFEASPLFDEYQLVAAPVRGLHGTTVVHPGERFRFSSKYGTRFYLIPKDVTEIPEFDRELFEQWASVEPPVNEIKMVPVTSSVATALSTLRFQAVEGGQPVIELVTHVEKDRWGNEASATRSILVFGTVIAGGLALCLVAIRRIKSRRRNTISDEPRSEPGSESS